MRKIISLNHLSLDGFASGPDGELDWIRYDDELEQFSHALHAQTDAVVWGRRTYELMASHWLAVPGDPAATPGELEHARWLEGVTKVVVSRTLDHVAWNGNQQTLLIKDHLAEEINRLKQQPGKDIWFLGSPTLAQSFMRLDLIDEYRFTINPVVLGQGKPLFVSDGRPFALKLLESRPFPSGIVALRYEPDRTSGD